MISVQKMCKCCLRMHIFLANKNFLETFLLLFLQAVAVADVRRELTFCRKGGIPVLGIVENMSGYLCQHCSEQILVFSQGGGEELAKQENLTFLGRVPLDPVLAQCSEKGESILTLLSNSKTSGNISKIVEQILANSIVTSK